MLLSLPPELAATVSHHVSTTGSCYMGSRTPEQPLVFSPNVSSSYTEHLFYARRPSKPISSATAGMPRPHPPPTPGASSDLRGKEGASATPAFNLPLPAFQEPDRTSTSSATPSANGSDSSYRPASPTSPADLTRRKQTAQSGPVITKDDFTLPPPPTRSRKIIQMKPQAMEVEQQATGTSSQASKAQSGSQTGGKRKQNNAGTTAAGRKIARKTAHSLIERRRRSKMNEEFGVLKDMIPACKGQEMHKLAILQASIEYLRYLENCVAELKTQTQSPQPQPPMNVPQAAAEDDEDEDEEMEDDEEPATTSSTPVTHAQDRSGSLVSLPSLSQITTGTTTSPSVFSSGRHYSVSSASQASYSPYFHSAHTSPAFGPQLSQISTMPTFRENFGLGSPALRPADSAQHLRHIAEGATELSEKRRPATAKSGRSEHELDQEAAAALLMVNHDRRSWQSGAKDGDPGRSGTGMSVRDLLSG